MIDPPRRLLYKRTSAVPLAIYWFRPFFPHLELQGDEIRPALVRSFRSDLISCVFSCLVVAKKINRQLTLRVMNLLSR